MPHIVLFVVLLLSSFAVACAEPVEINPGQYFREYDTGTLAIRRDGQNRLIFEIESQGGNCHTCSLSGLLGGSTGVAEDGIDSKCDISFRSKNSSVAVEPLAEEACRSYCGARATFDGIYRAQPTACTSASRQASRDRFLVLYRSRHYTEAASTLQTLIAKCQGFMNWIEIDQVRSDLALSQHRSGKSEQCLATLSATRVSEVKDEEDLKTGNAFFLPPCDFDNYIEVAKGIVFNRALCTKAVRRAR